MLVHQHLFPKPCQVSREGDDIPDLPAIQLDLGQLVDVELEIRNINSLLRLGQTTDKVSPNLDALLLVEVLVPQGEVDAAFEGLVERPDAVGGEDQDAVVVLQHSEEDGYDGVLFLVRHGAFFEEDVCFV